MTEQEFYEKILDAEISKHPGPVHEFLGMTEKEYRETIHCRWCKKSKEDRQYCEPYNPYCCAVKSIYYTKEIKDVV